MITYNIEKLDDFLEEIKPMLFAHWEEIALNKDKIKLNPDYERYYVMEQLGLLRSVIVRDEGKVIGYYISMLAPHLHYKDCYTALNDILYLAPEYRKSDVAYKMFKFAEADLKELGVDLMFLHMKIEFPFVELCEAVGMKKVEYSYSKYIGE